MKDIEKWDKQVANEMYQHKAEELIGYSGRIDFQSMRGGELSDYLCISGYMNGSRDLRTIASILKKRNAAIDSISEYKSIEKRIAKSMEKYDKERGELNTFFTNIIPVSSQIENIYDLTTKIHGKYDGWRHKLEGLDRIIDALWWGHQNLRKVKDAQEHINKPEYDAKIVEDYPKLLKCIGLARKVNIQTGSQIDYELLERIIELGGWLFFKYPFTTPLGCPGVMIEIPKSLLKSENLDDPGKKTGCQYVSYEVGCGREWD